jgi:hypothetical protein
MRSDFIYFRSTLSFCAEIQPEKFLEKLCPVFQKSAFFGKFLPIIWLEIIHEFITKISSQKIGNFKNGFASLNTFLMKFRKKNSHR